MKNKLLLQLLKIMKFSTYGIIIQTILFGFLSAKEVHSQHSVSVKEVYISISFERVTVKDVLKEIEENTDYQFSYEERDLRKNHSLTIDRKRISVAELLVEISKVADLKFKQVDNVINVSRIYKNEKNKVEILQIIQTRNISGKVTSEEDGEGLPGVNVVEKGTTNGTVSDVEGNYSLEVNQGATVVFSSVGYAPKEITVENDAVINISLSTDVQALEEIVVVGYGTQRKKDVTGAISSVKGEALTEVPVASVEQSLSARMSGVQVINGSGIPGSGATIRVRGVGTLNNNEPLYVIDGVILGNIAGGSQDAVSPLSMINPNDIESIDILKDASATAIYGARAGNGVVIITTKRGTRDKLSISYETFASVNVLDKSKFNQMTGPEWADYYDRVQKAQGLTDYPGQPFIDRVLAGEDLPTYDWIGELTRNGQIQSHNLSLNGGSEKSNYYTSLSYFDQTGIVYGSDLERYTLRFNSDHNVGERIKFGNTLLLSRNITNRQGNIDPDNNANNYIRRGVSPELLFKPIYREDGSYAGSNSHDPDAEGLFDNANQHIIWHVKENINLHSANRVWGSAYLDYEIVDGLVWHNMGSIDFSYTKVEDYNDFNDIEGTMLRLPEDTRMSLRNDEDRTLFFESTLTFNKTFNTDHTISAMAGYQIQNTLGTFFSAGSGAFENTDYWFFNRPQLQREVVDGDGNVILLLPEVMPSVNNGQFESGINSYFGRFFYDYKGRYLLTATVRRDGSSRFGSDRRWGTFPALSMAWRISQEPFMPQVTWLSDLKLRAGYGISGSDNVPNYQYAAAVGQGGQFNYSFNGGEFEGATIARLANTLLAWEQINMINVAIDVGLFDNRLNVSADFYDKTTTDLFLPFAPALELGNEFTPFGNLGEVNNKGVDITINSVNLKRQLTWNTDLVFGTVKNEIIRLPQNADRFTSDGWQNNLYNISRVGEEIGALYGFELDGIFQTWDEVYDHAYQDQALIEFDEQGNPVYDTDARDELTQRTSTSPGDFRFRDLNGDGFIDADNDRTIIGSTIPDFTWGLTNNLSYKGLFLSVLFQGVHGVNVYNTLRNHYPDRQRLNAWDGEGSTNSEPRIAGNGNGRTSTWRVEDASFVRLRNVRLAYNLPSGLIDRIGMNALQIYVTGTNLFTITKYTGYDPEVGLRSGGDNETAGIDDGQYPLTRQFTAGVKLTF